MTYRAISYFTCTVFTILVMTGCTYNYHYNTDTTIDPNNAGSQPQNTTPSEPAAPKTKVTIYRVH